MPIYKKAYDFCLEIEKEVANFPRYHRFSIGTEMRKMSHQVLLDIIFANSIWNPENKKEKLAEIVLKLERQKILLRLAFDLKCLSSMKKYEKLAELLINLSRQCQGWKKSTENGGGS